ncbi:hypothetical protein UCU_01587 [Enterococcus faecalis EnGen0247]|nr:hypothetical protein UE1_01712 [Enterococcus faecalis EnGen0251]EOI92930.1 hypothetical protein UMA_01679 [Enterococcus faecalis EnGen0311]EOL65781.1 hypothetical protein UCU_01587 [Enterococcus faecalis EnGen0247]
MGERADTFLAHFNRIEKWMRETEQSCQYGIQ